MAPYSTEGILIMACVFPSEVGSTEEWLVALRLECYAAHFGGVSPAELAELIKEPSKVVRERESLLNRKQVLEDALKQVPSYWGVGA